MASLGRMIAALWRANDVPPPVLRGFEPVSVKFEPLTPRPDEEIARDLGVTIEELQAARRSIALSSQRI